MLSFTTSQNSSACEIHREKSHFKMKHGIQHHLLFRIQLLTSTNPSAQEMSKKDYNHSQVVQTEYYIRSLYGSIQHGKSPIFRVVKQGPEVKYYPKSQNQQQHCKQTGSFLIPLLKGPHFAQCISIIPCRSSYCCLPRNWKK